MSQVLLAAIVSIGAILNVVAKPWSSSESILERRRNDIIFVILWAMLLILAGLTSWRAARYPGAKDAFDLQDWTAIILPFALAAPYIMETVTTLVRQVEMIRWIQRSCVQALPLAWMYRTVTVGDDDDDGRWLRDREWASWEYPGGARGFASSKSFWRCTSRRASLFYVFSKWRCVLVSATRHKWASVGIGMMAGNARILLSVPLSLLLLIATSLAMVLLLFSGVERIGLLSYDFIWWLNRGWRKDIIARYDTMHFGRAEMQTMFDQSLYVRSSLITTSFDAACANTIFHRVMGSILTTTSVFENAFRKAYLVTPIYAVSLSGRKVLRRQYSEIGLDLDRLIKQIRVLLEQKHTAGLLSITAGLGTVEAALHDRIEHVLSVSMFFSTLALYDISSQIAVFESKIEERLSSNCSKLQGEDIVRERVVYIDARSAFFYLLWILIVRKWTQSNRSAFSSGPETSTSLSGTDLDYVDASEGEVEVYYITATFLSRCRYAQRYGFDSESKNYAEVRSLCEKHGQNKVRGEFQRLSNDLQQARSFGLLSWASQEYGLHFEPAIYDGRPSLCTWTDDSGQKRQAPCDPMLE